jgi:PAS domain S-box-containing protein
MSNRADKFRTKVHNLKSPVERFSAVIVAVMAITYILTFPIHKAPILVVIPVAVAAWFYGIRGGWVSSVTALLLNLYLYNTYHSRITFYALLANDPENFILVGHVFVFLAGLSIGDLRKLIENRERMEAALRASEEQYRAIVEKQTELICRALPDGTIVFANKSYLNFFGKTAQEIIGTNIMEREQPGRQYEMIKSSMMELGVKNPVIVLEECFPGEKGEKYWVQWVNQAVIENGTVVEIQLTGRNITERKKAEEELLEREIRLATIFDNSADAIITIAEDQKIMSFSKSAEKIFGFTETEVYGKPLDILLPARFINSHHEYVHNFANSLEESRPKDRRRQIFGMRKDGIEFPAEASISKFKFKGKVIFAVFLHDISEPLQKEKELQAHARFLSQLNDLTHSIIASTDFNSMMETIANNFANLLEADTCYITRWDALKEQAFPVATNIQLSQPYTSVVFEKGKKNLTLSALQAGKIIVAEDHENSPYTNPEVARNFPTKSAISIPLIYGERWLGAAIIGFNEPHRFTQNEIDRAEQAGSQIALAVWNMQQDVELQRSLREEKSLANIAQALSESEGVGLAGLLNLIVNSAKELIANAEQSVIHLYNKQDQTLTSEAVAGFADPTGGKRSMKLGEGIAGQVITSGETVNIFDVKTDPRFVKLGTEPTYRSLMVAPVHSGEQTLGTISIQSSIPYAFTPNDNKLISQLGTHAAIAIENANLLEKTKQALKEANALYRVNKELIASLEPDNLLQDTVELLQENFDYYYVQMFVADPDSGNFVMRAGSGEIGIQLKELSHQLSLGEGIVGYTAETGTAFFTNSVEDAVWYIPNPLLPNTRSEMAVPVKIGGNILGVLDIQQAPPKYLTQHDQQLVSAVADQLAIALQRADLYKNLQISLQQEKAIRNQMMHNERLTVMGRLLATVAHELNNPLQAIQNALFLLKEEMNISPQGRQDLEIVLAESERMGNLIERLRDTYRPTQSEDFHPTSLNNIVEDVHALISTHLRHNNIVFDFEPDFDLPRIPALSDQIRQVTLNLFMNACEAMSGGGTLSVRTRLLAESNEVMLAVSDSGSGIPSDMLGNIFEAFVTNKPTGTGLGLTISQDIVLKHHGRISAENNPGCGATFTVWLPITNGEIV